MASNFSPECGVKCRSKQHALELVSAITKGTIEEVKAYFRLCYNAGQCCDVYGRTVLHVAAACGKDDIVEWILLEKQGDLTLKDAESGWTALHRAAFYGQLKTARLLILYNSDNYTRDQEGLSPLDLLMYDRPVHVSFSKSDPNEVYTWGDNVNLTLGHSSEQRRITPEPVELFRKYNITVAEVVLCKYHTVFLTKDGQVYTCGHGHGGRLGHGDEQTCLVPRKVECLSNNVCKQIAAARDHTVFLTDDGTVYSCGLNDSHQLGQFPTPPKCLSPKMVNGKNVKGKNIQGVCVGRFHTVLYGSGGVFTFGLNAGQLGHPKGTEKQSHPRQVSYLNHKDTTVVYAVCSDAATVCLTTNGDIYVLHEYHCRKIASKWQDITRIEVCGGNLDHNTDLDVLRERGGSELMIALLNSTGKVFMWRASSPSLKRCRWMIRRQLAVTNFSLSSTCLVFITDKGEAFLGSLTHRKATTKETGHQSKETTKEIEDFEMRLIDLLLKDEAEEVMVRRIPSIHRGTNIFVDSKGRNFAALQSLPSTCLTEVPSVSGSEMIQNFSQLLEEADEFDLIHDVIIEVGERSWPAHQYILLSRCDYFNKLLADARKNSQHDVPVITVNDVHPDIFEQLLMFIYSDSCDLLNVGSKFDYVCQNKCNENNPDDDDMLITSKKLSAFGMKQKKLKNGQKESQNTAQNREKNPVKVLQDVGRKYGVKGLSKRLECVVYRNGVIEATNKHMPMPTLRFDRHKHQDICDVSIKAEDTDHVIQCHKSVLVARLEYFHSMLGSGWIETSNTKTLTLPVADNILEIVIDFLYTDECKVVTGGENIELLCNILVVADQMLITRLRELCEVALSGLINLKNVGELLEISSIYNAGQLKASCQQFIVINLPALMEGRFLDVVSDEVLQDLEKYYHKQVPSMSRRMLTPYQDGPSKSYLEELASELPEDDVVLVTSRKSKPKRRKGSRTKSLSEDTEKGVVPMSRKMERQISMSSDTSYRSEEEMESSDILATSPTENEIMFKEQRHHQNMPSETTCPQKIPPKDKTSMWSLQSPPSSLPRGIKPTSLSQSWVATPAQPHLDTTSPTAQLSPPGFSLRDIMEEESAKHKSSNTWKTGKFSWKEAKKHQSQVKAVPPPNQQWNLPKNMPPADQFRKQTREVTSPESQQKKKVHHSMEANKGEESSPWGGVSKVCKSFRELMVEDENQNSVVSRPESSLSAITGTKSPLLSWGLPTSRVQKSRSDLSTSLPKDTGNNYSEDATVQENPWHKVKVQSPTSTTVSFTDIVKDEIQKHETRARATTKPLGLIQIEEQAIQELLRFYGANENLDEHITVERVPQEMAAPLWTSVKQQNKPGFQLQ